MMRSMNSAVSSLRAHQTKMDVIGNNIANVNTVGFKKSRVTFKETYNQTIKGAGASQDGRGGTNPTQIGLGADLGSIDVLQTRGTPDRTDNPTDLMINGEGFFMVSDDANYLNRYYTRAGDFKVDDDGNLTTGDGYKVLGYMADETGRLKTNIEGLKIDKSLVYPPQATKPSVPPIPGEDIVSFTGNLYSSTDVLPATVGTPAVNTAVIVEEGGTDAGIYKYDDTLSTPTKPVYTQKNDILSKSLGRETTIEVYDDLGNVHQIKMLFTKVGEDTGTKESTWQVDAFYMDKDGAMVINGQKKNADGTFAAGDAETGFNYTAGFKLIFGADGKFKASDPAIAGGKLDMTIGTSFNHGADKLNFPIDLSQLTQVSDNSNASATKIKGYKQGTLSEYSIAQTGEIIGGFSNGQRKVLGRVALANFTNPAGLQKTQSNMYMETKNSGIPVTGLPSTNGFADLNPGSLEMSNVDLAAEFTNMITTQRGFQANSRVITTTDQMLEELVNLKR